MMNIKLKFILSILIVLSSPCFVIADSNKPSASIPSYQPYSAENGSYRGQISPRTHRPKDVHVKGYTRKDDTYVRGHYRSKKK